ncbi:MAG: asparagine--tRNA ligase [Desulfobacterales bacterium]|nr:asparagine--tRNA ligase [Desulfobacterales bacterium]
MKRSKIKDLLHADVPQDSVLVKGWVRTRRDAKDFSFIEVNDGSCLTNIQIVAGGGLDNFAEVKKVSLGTAVIVSGRMIRSAGKGQQWEVAAEKITLLSPAPESYPLQKKRHSDEFLRTIAHLRPRTNKYGAVFRIRSELAYAVHDFFRKKGFTYVHTPIITASDCEGAGEMFQVTALDLRRPPQKEDGATDFSLDFFGAPANLTVSGQLSAEMFALSLGDVYTFGPTFRAENSNTRRHAAEFWMVEPEMAFCDLGGNMDLAEETVKYLIGHILTACREDMELFIRFVDPSLGVKLENILSADFVRLRYESAVEVLEHCGQKFQYPAAFGADLQSEHERYLTEQHFKKPVMVYDYPAAIKPFYMRCNDDHKTVAAMDVLVPGIGEIIGGSQREERLDVLVSRMAEAGLSRENYWWYIDSRRFGSVEHSGFGLGFERLMMLLTGMANIRDVIPFPRTPGSIDF